MVSSSMLFQLGSTINPFLLVRRNKKVPVFGVNSDIGSAQIFIEQ